MEFLVKVKAPDELRQKDIIEEMRFGLHYVKGSAQKDEQPDGTFDFDDYVKAIERVKITPYYPRKPVKKLRRKGG